MTISLPWKDPHVPPLTEAYEKLPNSTGCVLLEILPFVEFHKKLTAFYLTRRLSTMKNAVFWNYAV
jgi:hypothetical protein